MAQLSSDPKSENGVGVPPLGPSVTVTSCVLEVESRLLEIEAPTARN